MSMTATDPSGDPEAVATAITDEIGDVLVGNADAIEHLIIALLTRGHLLLEGVPGVGKTTIANLFARASGLEYQRVQLTPDILPADITGTNVYRQNVGEFELQKGPIFTNLLLADEINRTTPKTQSALLEAMEERQVSIERQTLALPQPFMLVATQNPIESEGVFALPEAQRDRFQFKITVELPDREEEAELIDRFDADPELGPNATEQVVTTDAIHAAQRAVAETFVADPIKSYVLDIVEATRAHPDVSHGASPRASITFINAAKARAALRGRSYVLPDDIKALAEPILVHRLVLTTDAELSDVTTRTVIEELLENVSVPALEPEDVAPSSA